MSEELGPQIEAAVNGAIEAIVQEQEGGFVLKWVALIETVGPDGSRGVWTMTSADVKAWDTLGLLKYGMALQERQIASAGDDE